MKISPWAATQALARDLADAGLSVGTDATGATATVLAGHTAVVLSAPRVDADDYAAARYTWRVAVIGAPVRDEQAAGAALDQALTAIASTPDIEVGDAEPITWTGTQTATAPAYLLTLTRRYPTT
ncbi:hypothetical protein [Actinomyces faecalis]|uniref:hypothetical protein n=1 Tax=Actinomyces faecalis TaxID=2722820 RepID=UPI001556F4CD|nr:hypothetical protein [Actinomyces faecalis]